MSLLNSIVGAKGYLCLKVANRLKLSESAGRNSAERNYRLSLLLRVCLKVSQRCLFSWNCFSSELLFNDKANENGAHEQLNEQFFQPHLFSFQLIGKCASAFSYSSENNLSVSSVDGLRVDGKMGRLMLISLEWTLIPFSEEFLDGRDSKAQNCQRKLNVLFSMMFTSKRLFALMKARCQASCRM